MSNPDPKPDPKPGKDTGDSGVTRRRLLIGGLGIAAGGSWGYYVYNRATPSELDTFIAKADRYDESLADRILEGLTELGVSRGEVKGKNVLLKPNLVETDPNAPHINTHPQMILAATEAFRRLDAAEVAVAEGQGHRRDSYLVLEESGLLDALDEAKLAYTDLNHDDLRDRPNRGAYTGLSKLVLPRRLDWADILVSMPKMKTHHWVGATLSMKNLFGIMPGVYYGWPKNVLHKLKINHSIVDINATVRFDLAIVDGIVGMEGDGPIMGTPKEAGVIVMGRNLPAVDATCARIMNIEVESLDYLVKAVKIRLGRIGEHQIAQWGASLAEVQNDFAILDVPHLHHHKG